MDVKFPLCNALQPCFLPKKQASCLAAPVPLTIAAEPLEVNRVCHAPALIVLDGIASLMGGPENAESSSTILEHLRHEGERVEVTAIVQCGEDLINTPHLHPFPCSQSQHLAHR
jgi:hypothetical protein